MSHFSKSFLLLGLIFIIFVMYNTYKRANSPQYKREIDMQKEIDTKLGEGKYKKVIVAGGCFWCTEAEFNHLTGVVSAVSGYADSEKENPSYDEVSSKSVKAREAVEVIYDENLISFSEILEKYFSHIDPTDTGGQFGDRGHQYTAAIYYTEDTQKVLAESIIKKINESHKFENKVSVEVLPFVNFYAAEEYHQDYKDKNPVRYTGYREASGRNSFVRENWQDGSTTTKSIFSDDDVKSEKSSWVEFDEEKKKEKLKTLSDLQYKVTQESGTEPSFKNEYNANKEAGIYVDIVSGEPLYLSTDKYDSGTGWPSFVKPIRNDAVKLKEDKHLFYSRTEVVSSIANSHLGHVFDDGPKDRGGKRYCMNSAAMKFIKLEDMESAGYGEYVSLLK